jgi:dihydroorotase
MCHGPQRVFGIVNKGRIVRGYDADFTIVDMKAERTIEKDWLESKCGWSPYEGMTMKGWPRGTILRGRRVMWEDDLVGPSQGQPIRFWSNPQA